METEKAGGMKIIEAMKEIKRLEEKVEDLRSKVAKYCADLDYETPTYPDQKKQVAEWMQSIHDSLKAAMDLRIRLNRTNLQTIVPIELGGQRVEHSIAEWIVRRRLYANVEKQAWDALTNRGLKEGMAQTTAGDKITVKIRYYFDPVERDKQVEVFRSEPSIIDRTLEVVNATTEIAE